ncbi:MAG: hypothetical protein ACI9EK_001369, partial [Psychroserpens sp.]
MKTGSINIYNPLRFSKWVLIALTAIWVAVEPSSE